MKKTILLTSAKWLNLPPVRAGKGELEEQLVISILEITSHMAQFMVKDQ